MVEDTDNVSESKTRFTRGPVERVELLTALVALSLVLNRQKKGR